jgi:hypothetical protein
MFKNRTGRNFLERVNHTPPRSKFHIRPFTFPIKRLKTTLHICSKGIENMVNCFWMTSLTYYHARSDWNLDADVLYRVCWPEIGPQFLRNISTDILATHWCKNFIDRQWNIAGKRATANALRYWNPAWLQKGTEWDKFQSPMMWSWSMRYIWILTQLCQSYCRISHRVESEIKLVSFTGAVMSLGLMWKLVK